MGALPSGFEIEPTAPKASGGRSAGKPSDLPPGFQIDPLASVRSMGVTVTSGWRTPEDQARLKRNGYTPAPNSLHLSGDAIDLTPAKGMTWGDLYARANGIAQQWGNGAKALDESRTGKPHVHLQLPGWGEAPVSTSRLPAGFKVEQGSSASYKPTGAVHDGDTLKLTNGKNGRLFGADAFELAQKAQRPDGKLFAIGKEARDFLTGYASPDVTATGTGSFSYGRPVVNLENDAGRDLIRNGYALAATSFLKGSPQFNAYMEAERLARLNRLGAHGNTYQTPQSFRAGNPEPWQQVEPGKFGEGQAVFADEPLPSEGLRPDVQAGRMAIWLDMNSKPEDMLAYAKSNGFKLDPAMVREQYEKRDQPKHYPVAENNYLEAPRLLTDVGDGKLGVTARGVADPINMLDELGALADTAGLTTGRENLWNSDRRFGDILWNNIDQNRSILANDEATHPYYRLGGQLASGILIPVGGGARTLPQLATIGAIEGGLAGLGAGEGNLLQRAPNAAAGAAIGAAGGSILGKLIEGGGVLYNRLRPGRSIDVAREVAYEAAPVVDDGLQAAGPTPAARNQPSGGVAEMRMDESPSVSGRVPDYINVNGGPPMNPVGKLTPATPPHLRSPLGPEDVVPVPRNYVDSFDEAVAGNPPSFQPIAAPDEFGTLASRKFPSNGSRPIYQRGPVDLVGFLRSQGGVMDQGGELSAMGLNNAARKGEDFAGAEGFLGKLVNERGMTLDEATQAATDAGYFHERPSINEFLDALSDTHRGVNRLFRPDDLGEVEAFNAARDQRFAVEQAAEAGSPLSERKGSPVGFDDLPDIPTLAYEDLPAVTGKVGNINLDKIETSDDVGRALKAISDSLGDNGQRVSHAETAELAAQMGLKPEQLLQRRQGQALNHAEAYAARNLHAASLSDTVARAKKAIGGTDEERAAFLRSLAHTAAIQDHIAGATAEAGRALSQYRMVSQATKRDMAAMKALIEGKGGHQSIDDLAEGLIELERDPGAANRFIQNAAKPSWKDKAVELYYNSLLSGPQTHAVNIVSNALTAGLQAPEHVFAATLGGVRYAIGKVVNKEATDRVMGSELGPRIVGLMQGAMEGLRAARQTFKTGVVPDHVTKVEAAVQEAIPGRLGHLVRTPTRALSAEDEFFKAVARRSELAGLAVRKARGEGLKGEAFKNRVDYLTANPTDDMVQSSLDYARYLTFQRPVGDIAGAVLNATQKQPWLKLIVPFVRTPTNILKFAAERSPAAPMLKEWRADFMAGGARRDLAVARMTMGSGAAMVIADLASQGLITGSGPADENARRVLLADGWQPYSIKVGDRYYSYQRMDPMATTLGVAADYVGLQETMTDRQREEAANLVTASIVANLSDKTWLSGLSDAVAAIHDPQRNGQQWINRTAGTVVPTGLAQLARTVDATPREAKTPLETILSRIPGLAASLRPRLDAWGQPIEKEGGVGPDIVSPVYTSTRDNDPVNAEALRLGLKVTDPSRAVGGKRLGDAEYHRYRSAAGSILRANFSHLIASAQWQSMRDADKRAAFDKLKRDARSAARASLFGVKAIEASKQQPSLPPGFEIEGR